MPAIFCNAAVTGRCRQQLLCDVTLISVYPAQRLSCCSHLYRRFIILFYFLWNISSLWLIRLMHSRRCITITNMTKKYSWVQWHGHGPYMSRRSHPDLRMPVAVPRVLKENKTSLCWIRPPLSPLANAAELHTPVKPHLQLNAKITNF